MYALFRGRLLFFRNKLRRGHDGFFFLSLFGFLLVALFGFLGLPDGGGVCPKESRTSGSSEMVSIACSMRFFRLALLTALTAISAGNARNEYACHDIQHRQVDMAGNHLAKSRNGRCPVGSGVGVGGTAVGAGVAVGSGVGSI